jgi:type IV pilus assembly protein PilA
MLTRFIKRAEGQDGFTLIELMVVVLIISILIAIALPTFLGARSRAQNRAAQSDLSNALVAAKVMYQDNSSYAFANEVAATGLFTVEPSLCYAAAATLSTIGGACVSGGGGTNISVSAAATTWGAARISATGACYVIKDRSLFGTTYGSTIAANCSGTWATTAGNVTGSSFP